MFNLVHGFRDFSITVLLLHCCGLMLRQNCLISRAYCRQGKEALVRLTGRDLGPKDHLQGHFLRDLGHPATPPAIKFQPPPNTIITNREPRTQHMNWWGTVSIPTIYNILGEIILKGNCWLCGNSMFHLLRNCHTVF